MPIFGSLFVVVLTIVACVAGAPSRLQDSNIAAYMDAVLARAEVDKAMARNQELLDWPSDIRRDEIIDKTKRNLDQIGGGNLLRNLDHIGGGNLLRNVRTPEKFDPSQASRFNYVAQKPKSLKTTLIGKNSGFSLENKRSIIDEDDLQSYFNENSGGNLLKDSQFYKNVRSRLARNNLASNNDRSNYEGTLNRNYEHGSNRNLAKFISYPDYLDERNKEYRLVGIVVVENSDQLDDELNEQERNLDHLGGGNLLRDLADHGEHGILPPEN